jgi:hypothetical protein
VLQALVKIAGGEFHFERTLGEIMNSAPNSALFKNRRCNSPTTVQGLIVAQAGCFVYVTPAELPHHHGFELIVQK